MICHTFITCIINTFYRVTVYADHFAGLIGGIAVRIMSFSSLGEAVTTGFPVTGSIHTTDHDISLTAISLFIIGTVFYPTL